MTTIKTSTTGTTYTYRKPANKDKAAQRGKVKQATSYSNATLWEK